MNYEQLCTLVIYLKNKQKQLSLLDSFGLNELFMFLLTPLVSIPLKTDQKTDFLKLCWKLENGIEKINQFIDFVAGENVFFIIFR